MARPLRVAADRARALFAAGFGTENVNQDDFNLISSDEEDDIDEELFSDSEEETEQELEEDNPPGPAITGAGDGPKRYNTYDDQDVRPKPKPFKPARTPGPHLLDRITRIGIQEITTALDVFRLFFTIDVLKMICENTNLYAWLHVLEKQSYGKHADGSWEDMIPTELDSFLALIIFMGFVSRPDISRYWAQCTLYSGGWARRLMSRNRFKAVLGMLHVVDPEKEDRADKLTKIRPLLAHMKTVSRELFQPSQHLAVDERMVKSKGRSGIRQFIANKPVRFGFKLWCLCDSLTGYTLDFNVYTGKRENPSNHGLAYDVVTELARNYSNQGYQLYFDNFYTSLPLLKALDNLGFDSCGTTLQTRRGFPQELRDKQWGRKAARGEMRCVRTEGVLCLQWKDNKVVSMCSTLHCGKDFVMANRKSKTRTGAYERLVVRKPMAVHDYNKHMGGVDRSDQMISTYNVLLKSHRWWKTLFFHLVDVAVVNSFILFQHLQAQYPEVAALQRPSGYSQLAFREELVRQLGRIQVDEKPPVYVHENKPPVTVNYCARHLPEYTETRRNCKLCYLSFRKECRTNWKCINDNCNVFLCLTKDRNCFQKWHSPKGDDLRRSMLNK